MVIFSSDQHNYETSRQFNIKSSCRTNKYGKYSIIASTVDLWNKVQKITLKYTTEKSTSSNLITVVSNFYFKSY